MPLQEWHNEDQTFIISSEEYFYSMQKYQSMSFNLI